MANLYINDGKNDVSVGELGVILSKQQVILGSFERDIILRTAGNVRVQVGNKLYDLPFTTTDTSSGIAVSNTVTTILTNVSQLSTLTYPGDGNLVFITEDKSLYVASGQTYVLIARNADNQSIIYLSFDQTQTLTGTEKLQLALNTGGYVNQLSDVSTLTSTDIYGGQLIYSISEHKHYRLVNRDLPQLTTSWTEIYLSLDGGTITGDLGVVGALHLSGDYTVTSFTTPTTPSPVFTIGADDFTSGLAMWTYIGKNYIQSLNSAVGSGFIFLTTNTDRSTNQVLSLSGGSVGIGGLPSSAYTLNITGSTNISNQLTIGGNISSSDFLTGPTGSGFSISKDTTSKWTLEIDKVLTRGISSLSYTTQGLNGSLILNYTILVTEADYVEDIPIYISAPTSGRYSDVIGTVKPLSARAQYVKVVRSTLSSLDTDTLVPSYDLIKLSYAMGDRNSSGVLDLSVTYNQDVSTSYYTPAGNTDYSGSLTWVSGTTLLLINTIKVYYIRSTSMSGIVVGDLLYFKQWDDMQEFASAIHAEVVKVNATGYYVYAYDSAYIAPGTEFIKVGNTTPTGSFMQLNSSDLNSPFLELLTGISTFADFYEDYYYEGPTDFVSEDLKEDAVSIQSQTRVRIGDLSNITDSDLVLSTTQYGLYSDNAYLKGNFVLNKSMFPSVSTVVGVYSPFLMLNASTTRLEQIDMSPKITYWNAKADNTITITATGSGLTGGGDLTANRTFALDFTYLDSRYSGGTGGAYIALEVPAGSVNGSNTTFTLTTSPTLNSEMVFLNGLVQTPSTDYTVSGSVVTFIAAPFTGDSVRVTYLGSTSSFAGTYICLEVPSGAINGSNVTFTTAFTPVVNSEMIFLNGLAQQRTIDYTMSGSTITFTTAPLTGDTITTTYFKP